MPLITSLEIASGPPMFWLGKQATHKKSLFFREFESHAEAGKLPVVVREPTAFLVHWSWIVIGKWRREVVAIGGIVQFVCLQIKATSRLKRNCWAKSQIASSHSGKLRNTVAIAVGVSLASRGERSDNFSLLRLTQMWRGLLVRAFWLPKSCAVCAWGRRGLVVVFKNTASAFGEYLSLRHFSV